MASKLSKKEQSKKTEEQSSEKMETHGIWNGRFKADPTKAKFFKDLLISLSEEFIDEEGCKAILNHYFGGTFEDLDKIIATHNKREKKK